MKNKTTLGLVMLAICAAAACEGPLPEDLAPDAGAEIEGTTQALVGAGVTDTSGTSISQISSAVAQNQAFQAAMRTADDVNTQESMVSATSANASNQKALGSSTGGQSSDNDKSAHPAGGLYRN